MSSDVKPPRRRYDASGRRRQAIQHRWAMLQAARRLFLERGYAATTMPAVAAAAEVSVQSVYKAFGNKPALLKAVFDVAMAGDDEPVPMLQRAALGRVRDEPDPRRKLALYGDFVAEVSPRHVPIQLLARAAAATDPEAAGVWEQLQAERLTGMTIFARPWTRRAICARGSRWRRPATCSGATTRRSSGTCSCSSGAGRPNGTAAGWPPR